MLIERALEQYRQQVQGGGPAVQAGLFQCQQVFLVVLDRVAQPRVQPVKGVLCAGRTGRPPAAVRKRSWEASQSLSGLASGSPPSH